MALSTPEAGPIIADAQRREEELVNRSRSSLSSDKKEKDTEGHLDSKFDSDEGEKTPSFYRKYRPYILAGVAMVILGWWISATILLATRKRWCAPRPPFRPFIRSTQNDQDCPNTVCLGIYRVRLATFFIGSTS